MYQICQNANENGLLTDPRVVFDSLPNFDCGYLNKFMTTSFAMDVEPCCGNCKHYSVQDLFPGGKKIQEKEMFISHKGEFCKVDSKIVCCQEGICERCYTFINKPHEISVYASVLPESPSTGSFILQISHNAVYAQIVKLQEIEFEPDSITIKMPNMSIFGLKIKWENE